MILAGFLIAGAVAAWLALAACISLRQRITFRQALAYAPLALVWRVDARALRKAGDGGPVIYVVSHQSRLDPALMLALLPNDTLHILDAHSAKAAWLEPWRALARCIAFNPAHLFVSRRLVRVLRGGGRLCVYMPPQVEPDQRAFRLYRAVARVAARAEAKVMAIHVAGARNSPFTLAAPGDAPRRLLPKLRVTALEPATIEELTARAGPAASTRSNALFDRLAEARVAASDTGHTLFSALAGAARLHGLSRVVLEDAAGGRWSYRRLLTATRVLAERIAGASAPGDAVGLLLANGAPTAAAFFALQSAGRVAAMLSHGASPANAALAVRTGDLRVVVSSRAFVEKVRLAETIAAIEAEGARLLWLEDLGKVGTAQKILAALTCRSPAARSGADDAAVMLFPTDSEGAPKAVLLSHRNMLANVAQLETRLAFSPADKLFNPLPVFHAFGLTGGMTLPLLRGMRLFLHPSPRDGLVAETAAKARPSILLGTDTLLNAWARDAKDADFASLRLVVAGVEPVRAETRRIWRERFHVDIVEGYGMSEAAPVVAVNSATHGRHGTVGRLLPGMRASIEPVEGLAEGGRLLVRGPNVMLGHLSAERPGETVAPPGGWHDSGDIVSFDKDGFLTILGRAGRFARIGGEMVPLGAVEMLARELWPQDRHAAVALPDARKGERVVLVTTAEGDRDALRAFARRSGAASTALPSAMVRVEEIPSLDSGKIDYEGVWRIAEEAPGVGKAA